MHNGNLSFVPDHGRPYEIAPAYDMLPMAFRPDSGGRLPDRLNTADLQPCVPAAIWRQALASAETYLVGMREDGRFTAGWMPCLNALGWHVEDASRRIERLG